jgi:hypothetical protein
MEQPRLAPGLKLGSWSASFLSESLNHGMTAAMLVANATNAMALPNCRVRSPRAAENTVRSDSWKKDGALDDVGLLGFFCRVGDGDVPAAPVGAGLMVVSPPSIWHSCDAHWGARHLMYREKRARQPPHGHWASPAHVSWSMLAHVVANSG